MPVWGMRNGSVPMSGYEFNGQSESNEIMPVWESGYETDGILSDSMSGYETDGITSVPMSR